jgi:glycosyltransferase involved in cell wall biosynthesis
LIIPGQWRACGRAVAFVWRAYFTFGMKILFLSNVLPYPLDAGPKVRSYYVLRYLAQFHRVTLVTHLRREDPAAAVEHLRSFCEGVQTVPIKRSRARDALHLLLSLARDKPFLVVRDDLETMREALSKLWAGENFDAVHADQLSTGHYALRVPHTRRVLDQHNAVWTIVDRLRQQEPSALKRAMLARETRALQQHEAAMGRAFDQVVTVTAEDRRALLFANAPPRAPMLTIPICIDPFEITPIPYQRAAQHIVCLGGMFYPPNVDGVLWFGRQVMPRLWREFPETKFFIVGARPVRELIALGESDARFVVTGYAANPDEYLVQSAAFVVPLRAGGGMRVKILDAWARGLPLVTTTVGGEGIAMLPGENVLVADAAEDFANQVRRILHEREFAEKLARNGRAWVEQHYDWRTVYRAFDAVYPRRVQD